MDLLVCILLPFAVGLLVRKGYKNLTGLSGQQLMRWIARLEFLAKCYFALGALGLGAGAAYIASKNIPPEHPISMNFYGLMMGWLLGFAAIQFMRRHYHTGGLAKESGQSQMKVGNEKAAKTNTKEKKRKNIQ